jgi:septal ring factor EnvC (AmiA/AmiB activator)
VRISACLLLLPFLLAAASAPVEPQGETLDASLNRARAEQAAAEAQAAKLEHAAGEARDQAGRLRAEQAAAAQSIDAAEARITASDVQLRLAAAYVVAHQRQLLEEQRPVAALLAGLAVMAQRPPLLAIADQGGTDELVQVRILLDSTMPVIRNRTTRLSAQLAEGQKLEQAASAARLELVRSREVLQARRERFAALERRSLDAALAAGGQALGAGDVALAAGEDVERLHGDEASSRAAMQLAAQLAVEDAAPPRPFASENGPISRPPFEYQLPVAAPVTEGLGSVSASGVKSRGIALAAARGAPVTAPAAGTVRFSGPFRDYDGIVILDHGGGWISLIVNISSQLTPGTKVALGDPIGRALGPLQVELSQNGRRISPALIAGSSQSLSKDHKGG